MKKTHELLLLCGASLLMWNAYADVLYTNVIHNVTWVYTLQADGASLGGGGEEHSALPFGAPTDVIVPSKIGNHTVVEISSGVYFPARLEELSNRLEEWPAVQPPFKHRLTTL